MTSGGVEITVTIYRHPKDCLPGYTTDASGKAANEDSYTITAQNGIMKNDRTLGEISIQRLIWMRQRYITATILLTAMPCWTAHVYDLYAAEDITHPDGVTGVVDYSKIVDADGNPHLAYHDPRQQRAVDRDYLPVLKKDNLVASAKIEDGWLIFANLYLGKYYV